MCRTGCASKDHASYGDCLRDANIQIDRYSLVGNNQTAEKAKNHTLGRYKEAREAGFQPEGCLRKDMDAFDRSLSDKKTVKVTND